MDCFYQTSRIRQSAYLNSPPLMYGYGVPTYYSPQFFPVNRNSEIHRPPVISRSSPPLGKNLPNPVTISSESNASPVSTASQTPPESPSESSTETHETTCSERNEEPCQSGKDASESEEKTGTNESDLFVRKQLNTCKYTLKAPAEVTI